MALNCLKSHRVVRVAESCLFFVGCFGLCDRGGEASVLSVLGGGEASVLSVLEGSEASVLSVLDSSE